MTGCRASLRGPASLGRNLCSGPLVLGLPEPVEQQAQAGLHPGQRPCLRGEMPGCRYQRRRSGARTADAVGRWPLISPERCFGREDVPLCGGCPPVYQGEVSWCKRRMLPLCGGCPPRGDVPRGEGVSSSGSISTFKATLSKLAAQPAWRAARRSCCTV